MDTELYKTVIRALFKVQLLLALYLNPRVSFRKHKCLMCSNEAHYIGVTVGGSIEPEYCNGCRKELARNGDTREWYDMRIRGRMCKKEHCLNEPVYTKSDDEIPSRCYSHPEEGMMLIASRRCITEGCIQPALYTDSDDKNRKYCKSCAGDDMWCVFKTCQTEGCKKAPTYGETCDKPTHCWECAKGRNMVPYRTRVCKDKSGCENRAGYVAIGETKPTRCWSHKTTGMKKAYATYCEGEGCEKRASYSVNPEDPPTCCKDHKGPTMRDYTYNPCPGENGIVCGIKPSFGYYGGSSEYCGEHKKSKMICLRNKRCTKESCNSQAICGGEDKIPIFCTKHSGGLKNVIRRICEKCDNPAKCGPVGGSAVRCYKCRVFGDTDRPNILCSQRNPKCINSAIYGNNNKRERCEIHKLPSDENLVERECAKCCIQFPLNNNNLCEYCQQHITKVEFEKLNPGLRVRNKKEKRVADVLDANGLIYDAHDKMMDRGECLKYRPDFVFYCRGYVIIVECDENQHSGSGYPEYCEKIRMINITEALRVPTIFVRYNPDNYKVNGIPSKISRTQKETELVRNVKRFISDTYHPPVACMTHAKYLFYNDYQDNMEQLRPVLL